MERAPKPDSAQRLRALLNTIGGLLGLAGVAFVALRLQSYAGQIHMDRLGGAAWAALGALVPLSMVGSLLLAVGWWRLLGQTGAPTQPAWALPTYGLSQLARYVPGNIFQFAGRQALGVAAGVPGRALAKSAVAEIALQILGGATLGLLLLPQLPVAARLAAAGTIALIALATLRARPGPWTAQAFAAYLLFHALSGLMLGLVLGLVRGGALEAAQWPTLCGASALAWLAGLLTLGAPAGAGVREAALVLLLGTMAPAADLLVAIVLARAIQIIGDVLIFFVALWWLRSGTRHATA